ncbi:hypothetical protein [Acuticoccus yangtzensis]|uniref:hypothetical protein n=1 Tax=Acuticoccus yangtzensis TaxID=1443441 RepID=UPI0009495E88|nr:hypothetical protein [Acuticoccus yangtzensis]
MPETEDHTATLPAAPRDIRRAGNAAETYRTVNMSGYGTMPFLEEAPARGAAEDDAPRQRTIVDAHFEAADLPGCDTAPGDNHAHADSGAYAGAGSTGDPPAGAALVAAKRAISAFVSAFLAEVEAVAPREEPAVAVEAAAAPGEGEREGEPGTGAADHPHRHSYNV